MRQTVWLVSVKLPQFLSSGQFLNYVTLLDIDCAASSCHLKILQIAVKKGNNINAWILHHSESERRPQTLKVQSNVEHEVIFFFFYCENKYELQIFHNTNTEINCINWLYGVLLTSCLQLASTLLQWKNINLFCSGVSETCSYFSSLKFYQLGLINVKIDY